MAMTGYFKTFVRPRTHRPLSMLKYDPVGTSPANDTTWDAFSFLCGRGVRERKMGNIWRRLKEWDGGREGIGVIRMRNPGWAWRGGCWKNG